ncbi:uridine kinase [Rummeliibacillus sp. TYF005]|uniref:kinase n=1 Tax=Rummeliibacillus sp. TYF005 TaxID=2058214 RepID=UPI000F546D2D|nr:kinase [Rummeliibacillus sp. TYF005]RPJ94205.1 uridine kinase [Rummeliibacillus sp. TYF005]
MSVHNIVNDLFYLLNTRSLKERPFIVAIDGLSGAGKTTMVKELEDSLKSKCNVTIIHMDDHIVENNKRYNTGHDEWYEYYYLQWDIEWIKNNLLKKIHRNYTKISLPYYEKESNNTTLKEITISSDSIILIEGIFLQRKEWISFYDYIIFLDCPREIRYERVLNRGLYIGDLQTRLNKYKRRYWLGEEHYLKMENPIEKADKIINTN